MRGEKHGKKTEKTPKEKLIEMQLRGGARAKK